MANLITVGSGNDTIYINGSIATLLTSSGSSTVSVGVNDTIDAGTGDDLVSILSGSGLYIAGGDGIDTIWNASLSSNVTIYGGSDNNTILNGVYYIGSLGHFDTIIAGGNNVLLIGGVTDDTISSNYGNHVTIIGGAGNDSIISTWESDYAIIDGGTGNDTINSWGSYTSIYGGNGNDFIDSSGNYSSINGGAGNDHIFNYGNLVTISGDEGIDTIVGRNSLTETFIHSADTDIIYGFGSNDTLSLESGQVTSSVISGSDVILMTSNNGSIILKNVSSDVVKFGQNVIEGSDTVSTGSNSTNTSTTTATNSNDTIYVDTRNETIISGTVTNITKIPSNRIVDAGSGDDHVEILSGEELYISGGSGNDYIQNIDGNLVSMNGGTGSNTLIGANSESDLFIYDGGQDLIQNFGINDSLNFGSHSITSSIVSEDAITFRFDHQNSRTVTIDGVGSENLVIDDGFITYIASEDVDYESVEIFGSEIGSDSPMIVDNSDGITRRTIIRLIGSDAVSVESNFRTEDIKFAYYGSDGEIYTTPYRSEESRAFVALNLKSAEFVANPNSTRSLNYGFGTEGSIDSWNVSLGAGDDLIHIEDVSSGTFDGGGGIDYFHITKNLSNDVTLTGGSDTENFFYAASGTISNQSDQAIVEITDVDFNLGDVILVDAGVSNLTGDFFGAGKFYNFSNSRQASESGAIARSVFDSSDLVKNLGMDFSMARFANRSDATLGSQMSVTGATNVLWVNDSAAVIELENQTGSVLFFTDSNSVGDELYLGSQTFDDTIHAGVNDTIDAGGGNDQIFVGSSTRVILSSGSDTIFGWNSSDTLEFYTMSSIRAADGNLILESGSNSASFVTDNGILDLTYDFGGILGSAHFELDSDSGNVTISSEGETSVLDLSTCTFDEISGAFSGDGLILATNTSSLNLVSESSFSIASNPQNIF